MPDLTTLSPAEVDTLLVPVMVTEYQARMRLMWLQQVQRWDNRRNGSDEQISKAEDALDALEDELRAFSREYRRRPWTRVFVVPGGHAHRSTDCHTCYPTTQFSLVPEYSGKAESEIVDAAGERACTVCYPSAPVDTLKRATRLHSPAEKLDLETQARERAAREAKRAARDAKGITYRGGKLRDGNGYEVKTERTAEIEAVRSLVDIVWYGQDGREHPSAPEWRAYVGRAIEALSDKRGESPDAIRAQLADKAVKKYRRDFGQSVDVARFTV